MSEAKSLLDRIMDMEIRAEVVEGEVVDVSEPELTDTRFGEALRVVVSVKIGENVIPTSLFIREASIEKGYVHPRSTLYKILTRYKAKSLRELIGKRVQLIQDEQGFYRILTS